MPRLFSAVELPDYVAEDLRTRLDKVRAEAEALRWVAAGSWHITLGFYGNREHADRRGAWLRRRAAGLLAPRIRLASAGGFPGVLWIGVDPANRAAERALFAVAAAARPEEGTEEDYRPHMTVARWRRGPQRNPLAERATLALGDYLGPWWVPAELVLFSSQTRPDGPVYSAVERIPLTVS
ncbi:MAG TPA: RNA 2',3'-cyclic phosphodiesterase [Actinophytocola sp.]|uniref:RNA 2',3'-cyclic phosphodiesterase n=1 Tax=Actinophytocola sp. TaxID=1872138 RepID=UPI002DB86175|nr:RNA 2',3'-cyclic phosphodiesterase [Actinophytocola sp.]HEU5475032.1 RNA 2',3'-cyclic phosphodiesterase [Actinophytocola sp.]